MQYSVVPKIIHLNRCSILLSPDVLKQTNKQTDKQTNKKPWPTVSWGDWFTWLYTWLQPAQEWH